MFIATPLPALLPLMVAAAITVATLLVTVPEPSTMCRRAIPLLLLLFPWNPIAAAVTRGEWQTRKVKSFNAVQDF